MFVMAFNTPVGPTQCILTLLSNRMADEKIGVFHLLAAQAGCVQAMSYTIYATVLVNEALVYVRGNIALISFCFCFELSQENIINCKWIRREAEA